MDSRNDSLEPEVETQPQTQGVQVGTPEWPPGPEEVVSRLDADSPALVVNHTTYSESRPDCERASAPTLAAFAQDARPHIGVWTRNRFPLEDVLIAERAERNGHAGARLIDHQR